MVSRMWFPGQAAQAAPAGDVAGADGEQRASARADQAGEGVGQPAGCSGGVVSEFMVFGSRSPGNVGADRAQQ